MKTADKKKISATFYILISLLALFLIAIAVYIFLSSSKALGCLTIVMVLYLVLVNMFKSKKLWFDIAMSVICFCGGLAFIFVPAIGKYT